MNKDKWEVVAMVGLVIAASAIVWASKHPCDCEKSQPEVESEVAE